MSFVTKPQGISQEWVKECAFSSEKCIEESLNRLGLLKTDEKLISYEDDLEWRRGGAETYISTGKFQTDKARSIHFIAKSYITMGMKPSERCQILLDRRKQISQIGIKTPELYGYDKGTIYEEFIPYSVDEEIDKLNDQGIKEVIKIGALLDKLGYQCLQFSSDLRFSKDGSEVYYTDFGSDLGEPNVKNTSISCKTNLMKIFSRDWENLSKSYYKFFSE
jgi:hypothetical protein